MKVTVYGHLLIALLQHQYGFVQKQTCSTVPDSTISGCVVSMATRCFHAQSPRLHKRLYKDCLVLLAAHCASFTNMLVLFHTCVQARCCNTMHYSCACLTMLCISESCKWPSTSCTGVCLAITMLQYYICLGIVLMVILVLGLGLGLGFGIILYFVIGT